MWFTLAALAFLSPLLRSADPLEMRPEVTFQRVEQTMGFEIFRNSFRITKFNRTAAVINGTTDLFVALDNNFTIQFQMAYSRLGNNQYNMLPMRIPEQPFCDFYNGEYREYQYMFVDTTDFPPVDEELVCPFPAGHYWIQNFIFDASKVPNVAKGLYRITMLLNGRNSSADFVMYAKLTLG